MVHNQNLQGNKMVVKVVAICKFVQHHENIQFYWWVGCVLSLFRNWFGDLQMEKCIFYKIAKNKLILFNKVYTFIFFIKEYIFSGSKVTSTIVSSNIKWHTAIENNWSLSVANWSFVNDAVFCWFCSRYPRIQMM